MVRKSDQNWLLYMAMALVIPLVTGCGGSGGSDDDNEPINDPINQPIEEEETVRLQLTQLTAMEAVALMKAGQFTPLEYANALLEQAEKLENLNAFIYLNPDEVRAAAEAATRKLQSGEPVGALIGIPLVIKDSVDTAGIPTTGGTPSLDRNVPTQNAPFLQALLDQGAYVFGKTNLAEMSLDALGANDFYGVAVNPYDKSRVAGGSSGGTAAAVSARIAPLGIGEDTVGSIRVPSGWTGIVGFRPTSGRYSNTGIIPLAPHRDTPGPMARSLEDVILVDSVVTNSPMNLPAAELAGLRLGLPPSLWEKVDSEVGAVMQVTLTRLEERGVELVREDIPGMRDLVSDNSIKDLACAMFDAVNGYLVEHDLGFDFYYLTDNIITPRIAALMRLAFPGAIPQEECDQALLSTRPTIISLYEQYFAEQAVDGIVSPTLVYPAPPIGSQQVVINGEQLDPLIWTTINTEPTAFAGLPSLTIPVGLTEFEKLPVGLLIDGPAGEDRRVLAIGKAIEKILPTLQAPAIE